MANKHYRKWWLQMLVGFMSVSLGILAIVFSIAKRPPSEWSVWAAISIVMINVGLAFLGSSFVHKTKSDLIRRERLRHHHHAIEEEI